ncbi:MAG: tetratricopeptide repeat protein, partial [Myxococcales bacterium]|nr:tetratricopeptide repeat protein [Myxococcales bacterium]
MRRNRHRLLPRFTALALALALFAGCTYKNAMKRGDEAMASGQYDDAIEQYERALAKKPDSEEARSKLAQAREKAVEQKVGQSRDALARGEFASAVATASEAAAILPDSPAVQQLIGELVPAVIAESERLTAAARFADAMA